MKAPPGNKYLRQALKLAKETILAWQEANTPRLGAALAYYTAFAIAPLFVLVLTVSGAWFGAENARRELFGQLQTLIGAEGSKAIEALVVAASNKPKAGMWASILAIATLLIAATGVFVEIQNSLNLIWKVNPIRTRGIWKFVRNRLLSFAMVLGIGFLLLVSLVISAGLAGFDGFTSGFLPGSHFLWPVVNFVISLGVITLLFALILKILPEAKIRWRDVWLGGFLTALLFNLGKLLLGLYIGRSTVASAYGAAGSLIVILIWVYYSAQILFLGAEFTKVCATQRDRLKSNDRKASAAH